MFLLGQVLSYENVRDIIKFCKEERLVLLADEVDMLTIVQLYSIINIWLFFLGHNKLENNLSKEEALVKEFESLYKTRNKKVGFSIKIEYNFLHYPC